MNKSTYVGLAFAFVHFSVEVACFYYIYSQFASNGYWWIIALLFDALAFLPQSIIGVIIDKYPKFNIGLLGSCFILFALILNFNVISLVIIAIGNAMVHISGANFTLRGSDGKIFPNAIFVGGGSFGVITGQIIGMSNKDLLKLIPIILMLISLIFIFVINKKIDLSNKHCNFNIAKDYDISIITLLAFIGVSVRGYIAYAIPTDWKKTTIQAVALFCFMGIGKMMGGIVADKIGYRKTTYISLIVGLPFLLFGNSIMILSLIGVALFSMTMPVTIAILVSKYKNNPCLAFGITTVGLFVGTFPVFFVKPDTLLLNQLVVIALTLIAIPTFCICIKKGK